MPSKQADAKAMACQSALDDVQLQASQGVGLPAALYRTMQTKVSLPYALQCVCNSEARGVCLGVTEYTHVRKGAKPSYLRFTLHELAQASGSKPARDEVADKLLVRVQEAATSVVSAMGKGYRHSSISNEVSGNHLAGIGENTPFFCDSNHKSGCVVRRMVEVKNY